MKRFRRDLSSSTIVVVSASLTLEKLGSEIRAMGCVILACYHMCRVMQRLYMTYTTPNSDPARLTHHPLTPAAKANIPTQ